jgi:hypothetical protein
MGTPFWFPVSGRQISIPQSWELSLVPEKANIFDYIIDWDESLTLYVDKYFDYYCVYPKRIVYNN